MRTVKLAHVVTSIKQSPVLRGHFLACPVIEGLNLFQEVTCLIRPLLAHLAKGNVRFCHHLASIVCRPLNFHILIFTSENPQPNELKLGRKHL